MLFCRGFYLSEEMVAWIKCGPNYKPSDTTPTVYYQMLFLPAILLTLGVILSRWLTPYFQGFIYLLALFIIVLFVFRSAARINHISR